MQKNVSAFLIHPSGFSLLKEGNSSCCNTSFASDIVFAIKNEEEPILDAPL